MKKNDPNGYPKHLNATKVRALIQHYEKQSDGDAIAEAEAVYRRRKTALVEVPVKLLSQVRRLVRRAG